MWTWVQRTGSLYFNGAKIAQGYAGFGIGKNCPELQEAKGLGPIPVGRWRIVGEPFMHDHAGPYCLRLEPNAGTDTHGRSGFMIHGDSIQKPGMASRGCIVVGRSARTAVWESGDIDLQVVAEESQVSKPEEND